MEGVVLAFLDGLSALDQLRLAELVLSQMLLVELCSALELIAHGESLVQVIGQPIRVVIHLLIIFVICLRLLVKSHQLSMIFLLLQKH